MDKQLNSVTDAMKDDLDTAVSQVQNDDKLSAAEKSHKIQELEDDFNEEMERLKKEHERAEST